MSAPIKPSEVAAKRVATIPPEVFEAFNELIVENFLVSTATVVQNKVVERILAKLPQVTRGEIFEKGWLEVEGAYRKAGWSVLYDRPGYNESYDAYFEFRMKP